MVLVDPHSPKAKTHHHEAYGLSIHSEIPLRELPPGSMDAEVYVHVGRVADEKSIPSVSGRHFKASDDGVLLSYDKVGRFLIREGREIIVEPSREADDSTLRLFLLGPAVGVLLHQRGFLVLHASAVAIDGQAVAFLGGPRWGKSTVAGVLQARGYPVVTDDVLPVSFEENRAIVWPGFPQLKIWPDVLTALGQSPGELPLLRSEIEKRALRVPWQVGEQPLPLSRIYVLAPGDRYCAEPLRAAEGAMEIIRHTYPAALLDGPAKPRHLAHASRVARTIPMRRLTRPQSLASLPELVHIIEDDLGDAADAGAG